MSYKIQTFKGRGTQPWRWRVVARNGKIILSSEGYKTKRNRDKIARKFEREFGHPWRYIDYEEK